MRRFFSFFLLAVVLGGAGPLACAGNSDGNSDESGGTSGASGGASGSSGAGGGSSQGGDSGSGTGGASGSGASAGSGTSGSGGAGAAGSGGAGAAGSAGMAGSAGTAGSGGSTTGALDCDHRKITCRRAEPVCPEMQVPSVDGTCYGECVPIAECGCVEAEDCPHEESYTCHRSAMRCGPYVQ